MMYDKIIIKKYLKKGWRQSMLIFKTHQSVYEAEIDPQKANIKKIMKLNPQYKKILRDEIEKNNKSKNEKKSKTNRNHKNKGKN